LSQEFPGVSADAVIRIEEGQADYVTQPFRPKREVVDERIAPVTERGEYRGAWLLEPVRMPTLKLTGMKRGSPAAVTFLVVGASVVNLPFKGSIMIPQHCRSLRHTEKLPEPCESSGALMQE
jgi:hypothetical protein